MIRPAHNPITRVMIHGEDLYVFLVHLILSLIASRLLVWLLVTN